jgi:hypothetical protein
MATRASTAGNIWISSRADRACDLPRNLMRENAYAEVVDSSSVMMPDSVATFTEFHNQRSTGKGGSTRRPSGPSYEKPRASFQCSRLIWSGMRLPAAKLPGRREIDRIIRKGKMMIAIRPIRKAWAASTRQRWDLSRTMAMVCPPERLSGPRPW